MHSLVLLLTLAQTSTPGAELDALIFDLQSRVAALEALQQSGVYVADAWIPQGGDLADAVRDIQLDAGCSATTGLTGERAGCKILIGRGVYSTKTIRLCRQVSLEGVSGSGWGASTIIETNGETGIHIAATNWCETNGFPNASGGNAPTGAWSTVRDIALRDVAGSTTAIYSAGVHMEAQAQLRDLWIRGYTQGVRISADVTRAGVDTTTFYRDPNTNANVWLMDALVIDGCRHAGVYVDGGDSNAGASRLLSTIGNCTMAAAYSELGTCANVYDSSFLGNTHVAVHSAYGGPEIGNIQILTDGPSARNVFLGAYTETAHGPSTASQNDLTLGGIAQWDDLSDGMRIGDDYISGFCTYDDRTANRPDNQTLCFGRLAGTGLFAASSDSQRTLRLHARQFSGEWRWQYDLDNVNTLRLLMFTDTAVAVFDRLQGGL